jgi:hypothetical protein
MPHVTSTESEYLDAHNCLKVLEGDLGSGVARDGTLHRVGALLEDLRAQRRYNCGRMMVVEGRRKLEEGWVMTRAPAR